MMSEQVLPEKRYSVSVEVNGVQRTASVTARRSLVDFLREDLRLTGTHVGCEHGVCGACSILLDDEPVRSCLMYAVQVNGQRITTVEGLANADGSMSVLQDSFCETHGLQCGYCTPGMLISAQALLNRHPQPSDDQIRDAIGGNLCRCTGYQQIIQAVRLAAKGGVAAVKSA
jgi:carbon-monoxide dehydrogenase small subunit